MALTSAASGTITATVGTEHTLATNNTGGTFIFVVNTSNMSYGDEVILRIKTKTIATSTTTLAYSAVYAHIQGEPVKYSPPVPSLDEITVTLEQTAGTGRSFEWNLLKI